MNLKKIVIYHNDILFNILDEIKEKFNFSLEKVDKENFEELKKYFPSGFLNFLERFCMLIASSGKLFINILN